MARISPQPWWFCICRELVAIIMTELLSATMAVFKMCIKASCWSWLIWICRVKKFWHLLLLQICAGITHEELYWAEVDEVASSDRKLVHQHCRHRRGKWMLWEERCEVFLSCCGLSGVFPAWGQCLLNTGFDYLLPLPSVIQTLFEAWYHIFLQDTPTPLISWSFC